jgi:hypothetical protein
LKSPRIKDFLDKDNKEADKNIEQNDGLLVLKEKALEANSDFIPKEKRISHIETEAIEVQLETNKEENQDKPNAHESKSFEEKKEEVQEDKLISNEKTGVKLEIAHDENEEQFDYSDDDYDEEEN